MTLRNGLYFCDRCGVSVGNANVQKCAIVTDLDPYRVGSHRQLHLCRVNGCAPAVLSADNLPDYTAWIGG